MSILQNAGREDRFAHAYLFYGPRGTGKTTAARLVAKLANCETRASDAKFKAKGEPCNTCRSCIEIDGGTALDVIEIDAASNRGIDEIRNLKEGIRLSPIASLNKVFIIDEVHMLTTPAFNALLKTLEEPPVHTLFILATTEFDKVPATILSRTQRFQFKKLPKKIIGEKLHMITRTEKLEADDEALDLIAVAADGGLRDAESLLDQVTAVSKNLTLATVEAVLGRFSYKKLHSFAELLAKKDLAKALAYIESMNETGDNLVQFTKELIHYMRRVISLKLSPGLALLFENQMTAEEIKEIQLLGAAFEVAALVALIRSLIKSYSEMRYSPFAVVPLEIAVIEYLDKPNSPSLPPRRPIA